ncbi:MAG TPA: enolase C-terminal domain-like protein [Alphaproteobacteria bacterium]
MNSPRRPRARGRSPNGPPPGRNAPRGDRIARVETYCLELPYRKAVQFHSVTEAKGQYLLVRLVTGDGAEGIAESVARPAQTGEDPRRLAHGIETFFRPLLEGADPFDHNRLWGAMGRFRACRTERALVDVALWDLKGKLLAQPVCRLLGAGAPDPVPVGWIVHGDSARAQTREAVRAVEELGFSALKLKTWKRSLEDVAMVRDVRKAVGEDRIIWVDANGAYSETEARTILPRLAEYGIAFIEEPCEFSDVRRMALMAKALPVALLGDQSCGSLAAVHGLVRADAVGAVSVKLRRTGITESLKIIALAEAAGIPVVIGTDSESRIGALARIHLRAALPTLAPWPTETHFFEKLADDVFAGAFNFKGGCIAVPDAPGFGAGIDWGKLEKYRVD